MKTDSKENRSFWMWLRQKGNIHPKVQEFILFAVFSGGGALIDYIAWLILSIWIPADTANLVSYPLGVIIAFFLNRSHAFKEKDLPVLRFIMNLGIHGASLYLQQVLFPIFITSMGDSLTKIALMIINAVLMWIGVTYIVFFKKQWMTSIIQKFKVSKKWNDFLFIGWIPFLFILKLVGYIALSLSNGRLILLILLNAKLSEHI